MHLIFLFIVLFSSINVVSASESVHIKDIISRLAQDREWLNLLHHKKGYFFIGESSQVDNSTFFLSSNGKYSPESELRAFINELSLNSRIVCDFPARYRWLSNKEPSFSVPNVLCPKLEHWRDTLNAEGASLIFPVSYLNSPSSMYGHTFLRLDQPNQDDKSEILAYSVNFAANAEYSDNELVFVWKGFFGGYPGVISVVPYYEKVKEYNNMENRDIWEFKLNLSKSEVDQLVDHLWELRNIHFDYFFMDENCAYRILTILDVAKPDLNSSDDYHFWVIPSDTVRSLDRRDAVLSAKYRPSKATILKNKLEQLSLAEKRQVKSLSFENLNADLSDLPFDSKRKSAVLEAAYDYTRFISKDSKYVADDGLAKRSLSLLSTRSKLPSGSLFQDVYPPGKRDDQGHGTFRMTYSMGFQDEPYFSVSSRIAYHELMDPIEGYLSGAQIEMGEISFQYINESLRLDRLNFIDIQSLSPSDELFQQLSWRVAVGLDRQPRSIEQKLSTFLDVGIGSSYEFHGLNFGLLEGTVRQGNDFSHGASLGIGPKLGYLWQGPSVSAQLLGGYKLHSEGYVEQIITSSFAWHKDDNLQFRLDFNYWNINSFSTTDVSFSLNTYF